MVEKLRNILWVVLLALPVFLHAQGEPLSDKDQRKFDYYFFEAERYKQIQRGDLALNAFLECYKIDQNSATVAFELARLYAFNKDAENAKVYFEKAYALQPENKWIAIDVATFYQEIDELAKSTVIYEKLAEQFPSNVHYKYELASLYYNQRQYKKCLAELDEVEVIIGVNEELAQQKKDVYLLLDDQVGAQKELEKLVAAFPLNVEYVGMLAQFYTANEETDKAIATYELMLIMAPTDPRGHLDLANIYQRQKRYDLSVGHLKIAMASPDLNVDNKIQVLFSFFQLSEEDTTMRKIGYELIDISIQATPNEAKLYAIKGDYLLRDERLLDARNAFRKATELGANQVQLWSQILLLDANLNKNDTLLADADAFIELYPNQPLGYLMAGTANAQMEKYQEAANYYKSGVDMVIDNPELEEQFFISLADAYHRLNENKKSDDYFDKALDINPNNASTLNNYAYYLSERGVRLDEALEMADKANRLAPNNGVFLDTWAWVLYKKGKYAEALVKIKECANFGGAQSGEVLEHWGDILFKLDRKEEALAKWKDAASKPDAGVNIQKKIQNQQIYE